MKRMGSENHQQEDWREFNIHGDSDDEADNTEMVTRLFDQQEDDPYEIHTFHYKVAGKAPEICLQLRGRSECNQSTGVALWGGAEVLADYLTEHSALVQDKAVLEIGAGMGLCGILAHHIGAAKVVLTDGDVQVLENLRFNVVQNTRKDVQSGMECAQLIWGRNLDTFRKEHGHVNVILGSDVIYMRQSLEALWQTIDQLLDSDGVFVYVGRCASQASLEDISEMACRFGFCCTECSSDVLLFHRKK